MKARHSPVAAALLVAYGALLGCTYRTVVDVIAQPACAAMECGAWSSCRVGATGAECACTVYADSRGPAGDGSAWALPFVALQDAIDQAATRAAAAGTRCEVWVAAGVYRASGTGTGANATLRLRKGVDLLGGFAGSEKDLEQRDPQANLTVLDGAPEAESAEPAYHVVSAEGDSAIDGFTVRNGRAAGAAAADRRGGGLHVLGPTTQAVAVSNCVFADNAAESGGAVYLEDGDLQLRDVLFRANRATGGGAVSVVRGHIGVERCQFNHNEATYGGALAVTSADMHVTGSTFDANVAIADGGALAADNSTAELLDSVFTNNTARYFGGGAHLVGDRSPIEVRGCVFSKNQATLGGAIHDDSPGAQIWESRFAGNQAESGGALYSRGGQEAIAGCQFLGNVAIAGGAVFSDEETILVADTLWALNRATYGGAACLGASATLTAERTTWAANATTSSDYGGGGALRLDGYARLRSSVLIGNHSGSEGGSVQARPGSSLEVVGSTIAYSSAAQGLALFANGDLTLSGSLLIGAGSGLIAGSGSCVISSSSVTGGAGAVVSCGLDASNLTQDCSIGSSIPGASGTWASVEYDERTISSSLRSTTASWRGGEMVGEFVAVRTAPDSIWLPIIGNDADTIEVSGDVTAIVRSGDAYAVASLRLADGSPCIDTGDAAALPDDVEGHARLCGDGTSGCADIGAYEHP